MVATILLPFSRQLRKKAKDSALQQENDVKEAEVWLQKKNLA